MDKCSEYWGVEPHNEVAKFAANKLDKVIVGKIRTVFDDLPNNYFDLLICNDVLEHLEDENWFLANIKQKMKIGSIIIGSIPNIRYISVLLKLLIWRDLEYTDSGVLDKTHFRFFTKKKFLKNT